MYFNKINNDFAQNKMLIKIVLDKRWYPPMYRIGYCFWIWPLKVLAWRPVIRSESNRKTRIHREGGMNSIEAAWQAFCQVFLLMVEINAHLTLSGPLPWLYPLCRSKFIIGAWGVPFGECRRVKGFHLCEALSIKRPFFICQHSRMLAKYAIIPIEIC